jgi:hypothetical protein
MIERYLNAFLSIKLGWIVMFLYVLLVGTAVNGLISRTRKAWIRVYLLTTLAVIVVSVSLYAKNMEPVTTDAPVFHTCE